MMAVLHCVSVNRTRRPPSPGGNLFAQPSELQMHPDVWGEHVFSMFYLAVDAYFIPLVEFLRFRL